MAFGLDDVAMMAGAQAVGGGLGGMLGGLFSSSPDYNAIFGQLSPTDIQTLIKAGQLDGTAFDSIQTDPATRDAQMRALQQLQGVADAGGMDPQSRATVEQALQRTGQADRAMREAALQQMAMRSNGGGGAELATRLAGQQQETQANAMAGMQAASDARSRALQAMSATGQLGSQVRSQDWDQAAQKAQARDMINQWNAQNRVNAYNTNWNQQLGKAQGQAGMAPQQYQRDVGLGGAAGTLAGGIGGFLYGQSKKQQPTDALSAAGGEWM